MRDDLANFLAAGASLKNILAQVLKPRSPTSADPSGDGKAPVKPPKQDAPPK
jgi:hypothetical protein